MNETTTSANKRQLPGVSNLLLVLLLWFLNKMTIITNPIRMNIAVSYTHLTLPTTERV